MSAALVYVAKVDHPRTWSTAPSSRAKSATWGSSDRFSVGSAADISHSGSSDSPKTTRSYLFFVDARHVGVRASEIRLHDPRHTHATVLLGISTNPKIVSERLGHSSVSVSPWTSTRTCCRPSSGRRSTSSTPSWPRCDPAG